MENKLQFTLVTPEKNFVTDFVDQVNVPGVDGDMGILYDHAPIISTLRPGRLSYQNDGETISLIVSHGYMEVTDNRVTVLAETAEFLSDIDSNRAVEAKAKADAVNHRRHIVELDNIITKIETLSEKGQYSYQVKDMMKETYDILQEDGYFIERGGRFNVVEYLIKWDEKSLNLIKTASKIGNDFKLNEETPIRHTEKGASTCDMIHEGEISFIDLLITMGILTSSKIFSKIFNFVFVEGFLERILQQSLYFSMLKS